mmetsp:Transcript_2244/g.4560  ORF Transcript_2244/g.4560 Transcript_2244/m.4560 type:complete len:169 (-) Transcript_2244:255-761(-)|eukprot:CAMPEP_0182592484 /NCGR_PEP_ID=MMETSP1324-20130603/76050_1 /TAXON_ID=236786 /ORGANISM="Florenciella sp., Strain RCC1587" /LENGTH=168 /DNA_ID=CAMNT_0024809883 /DNA_START=132 /DNA_END=638 /DNA_ORIENTATION=+
MSSPGPSLSPWMTKIPPANFRKGTFANPAPSGPTIASYWETVLAIDSREDPYGKSNTVMLIDSLAMLNARLTSSSELAIVRDTLIFSCFAASLLCLAYVEFEANMFLRSRNSTFISLDESVEAEKPVDAAGPAPSSARVAVPKPCALSAARRKAMEYLKTFGCHMTFL